MTLEKKYSYDRFGSKGVRVGQAVHDIVSQPQPSYTAEEILEEMGKGIATYIQQAAEKGCQEYDGNFYILHIFKKALGVHKIENVMSQKAICFKSRKWTPREVMEEHPHAAKTFYGIDKINGIIKLIWTVPGWEDCKSIKKNPKLYDPDLVKWVLEATDGYKSRDSALPRENL